MKQQTTRQLAGSILEHVRHLERNFPEVAEEATRIYDQSVPLAQMIDHRLVAALTEYGKGELADAELFLIKAISAAVEYQATHQSARPHTADAVQEVVREARRQREAHYTSQSA